eukprot:TRINITY_DN29256_c0_g1_i1.p1 TRINITY_DN29256_c0_g1~~TRINITY_DN29256_c0_g1_i1.p1  ORF type:complete len:459 (+),score=64.64 TRINITY_DN29256_c0_g1_i1:66-1379(+)
MASSTDAGIGDLPADDVNAEMEHLVDLETDSKYGIEKRSVYGSALAVPQIARTLGYNRALVILSLRVWLSLFMNIALQLLLVCFIGEATQIMAPLGGEMHLCDFGKNLDACPGEPHCTGPGGTLYTRTRLYGYTQWAIQKFTRDALLQIMPDKQEQIEAHVDPGEYGMENYQCRLLCIFIFTMSLVNEVFACFNMAVMLWFLPTDPAKSNWIQFSEERNIRLSNSNNNARGRKKCLYKVAGMPAHWKVFNFFVVLGPKVALLHYVLWMGILFLMDTSGITDLVLGAMSMTFVLSLDEVIYDIFTSSSTKYIMDELDVYREESSSTDHLPSDSDPTESKRMLERSGNEQHPQLRWRKLLWTFFPRKWIMTGVVMAAYIARYYSTKCIWNGHTYVSKDMYLPHTSTYHVWDFVMDGVLHTIQRSKTPFWSMPDALDAMD